MNSSPSVLPKVQRLLDGVDLSLALGRSSVPCSMYLSNSQCFIQTGSVRSWLSNLPVLPVPSSVPSSHKGWPRDLMLWGCPCPPSCEELLPVECNYRSQWAEIAYIPVLAAKPGERRSLV